MTQVTMEVCTTPLWRTPAMRRAAGDTLRPGGLALTDRAAELAGILPGQRVLDVGCGRGATVRRLRSRFGARAVGLDLCPDPPDGQPTPLVRGHAGQLPFAPGSFHALVCECVLSLLDDPDATLAGFARVLKPGGVLALSDLYLQRPGSGACSASPCARGAVTRTEMESRLTRTGFRVLRFEDHSGLLRDLAARLAWQESGQACIRPSGLGYGLLLADIPKEDDHVR